MTIDVEGVVGSMLEAACDRGAREKAHPSGVVEPAWESLAAGGFPWIGLAENLGGSGGSLVDLVAVARATGRAGAPVPLAETALANWLRVKAGHPVAEGPATVSILPPRAWLTRSDDRWRIDGAFSRLPWARYVDDVVTVLPLDGELYVAAVPLAQCTVSPGVNLAGESRDNVVADAVAPSAVAPVPRETASAAFARGALCRAAQMSGALRAISDLTLEYARTRQQFGRPLSAFQLIQGRLALIEEGTASACSAVNVAAHALEADRAGPAVAAAKILAGIAADDAVAHSHQVHGALGLTMEYDLQLFVRRLAGWRWEFGSATYWSGVLAAEASIADGPALWDTITHSLTEEPGENAG